MIARKPPHRHACCLVASSVAAWVLAGLLSADAMAKPPATKPAAPAETQAEATAAAPVLDPMASLRQRLASSLSRQAAPEEAESPHELKIVARTAPAPTAPAAARPRRGPAGASSSAPTSRESSAARLWSYQGESGPTAWANLHPDFRLCGSGQRQSPVDIRGGLAVDLEPVKFAYGDARFGVIDTGRTVQAKLAAGQHIEISGERFELQHLEFRRPSEERIDGRQFEMSVHLVHRSAQGAQAVVALLIDRGPANAAVQTVWNNLPLEKGQESGARVPLELGALLPDDRRYYTYMGSLTTPPCSEEVRWVVMRQPVTMSPEQIDIFARIYPMNARPLQQLAGRRILQSQ